MANRTTTERIESALRRFASEPNVWVATGSMAGVPHLVPLSLAWNGTDLIVATPTDSPTVRNVAASGSARATLDSATDVVIVDAAVTVVDFADADQSLAQQYVERVGWDPRSESGAWTMLILSPRRIQAWNGVGEIKGRTIMSDGAWLTD
jgi:Pyridoxamine 5'-phosphate oxidase